MDFFVDFGLTPLAILVISWILSLLSGPLLRAFSRPAKRSTRVPSGLPAGPGQSLLSQFDAFSMAIFILAAQITALPLLLYGGYMTYIHFFPENAHWLGIAILAAGGAAFEINRFLELRRARAGYRSARFSYEDKLITGQALIALMHAGYVVFNEVYHDGLLIDHVVMGPKGLFVVQTLTLPRPSFADSGNQNVVQYDGRELHFANGNEHAAIEKTGAAAERFSEWLSEALPEAIAARPILAVPGWIVKRTSVEGLPVVSPKQFGSLFQHIGARPLDAQTAGIISEKIQSTYQQEPALQQDAPATTAPAAQPSGPG